MAKSKLSCNADKCKAFCCRYISVHLDTPTSKDDFDEIKWFISHMGVAVYKDCEDDWLVDIMTDCKHLKRNRCSIYETRPEVCRDYDPGNCTDNSGDIERKVYFQTIGDVDKYVAKRWPKKKKKKAAAKKKAKKKK